MGVRGLTTYINYNQNMFMKRYYLHDSKLVIDGNSLCAQLYRSMISFSAFGGDYDKYASHTKTFFKNLRKCNITPFIIFDGCHEHRKLKTVFSRLRSKLKGTARLDPVTQDSLHIFPYLLKDVFTQVLNELQISYTVCAFEADDEIAALARYFDCPVLSYDSDFFIYNVKYIPFNTLEVKAQSIEEKDNKFFALECRLFTVEYFCKHFGDLQPELLPLLATLLGNDYVKKRVFNKFFSQLKLQKTKKKKNSQQRNIHALFVWLQNETFDSAVQKVLGRLKKHQKSKVCAIIKRSVEGYHNNQCQSLKYFNLSEHVSIKSKELKMPDIIDEDGSDSENEKSETDMSSDSEDSTDEESVEEAVEAIEIKEPVKTGPNRLPDWLVEKIRHNQIPKMFLNLYYHHFHICNPQAEDFTEDDSFFCVLPVLRYLFDLLTDYSHDKCFYIGREFRHYRKFIIDRDYSVQRPFGITFPELGADQLKKCFYHFIGIKLPNLDWSDIELLPTNFQLFAISLLWWISYCNVPEFHLHSLVLTYIMLSVIDERTGTSRGAFHFNNRHAKKIEEFRNRVADEANDELFLNKNKVLYEDCVVAASVLLKHFEIDESVRKRPKSYDIKKIHCMAQFQVSLQAINSLNTLCGSPLDCTTYYRCYNGVLVYNIALKLENQKDPMNFLRQYLKGSHTVLLLYKSIFSVLNNLMEKMKLSTIPWSPKRKRPRRRRNEPDENDISFVVKGFESDVKI
ncbi:protein asteroid [Danaus plexippus]|uniref:protein asteroid n=1 Tax=Danaus plexippus TaxID=13037 RepID=UPI002AAFD74F|nr:protein asteroid [Danaus plexippus]